MIIATIWGDGIHDDSAGFEALVCKREFRYRPDAVIETREDGRSVFTLPALYLLPWGAPKPKDSHGPEIVWPTGLPTYEIDCAPTT